MLVLVVVSFPLTLAGEQKTSLFSYIGFIVCVSIFYAVFPWVRVGEAVAGELPNTLCAGRADQSEHPAALAAHRLPPPIRSGEASVYYFSSDN